MPIYAYRCENCGHQQDVLQKMSDPLLVTCPACGQPTYRKQVTAAGFQLKGSGWYVTDFRNPATKENAKSAPKDDASPAVASDDAAKPPAPATETAVKPAVASESKAPTSSPKAPSNDAGGAS